MKKRAFSLALNLALAIVIASKAFGEEGGGVATVQSLGFNYAAPQSQLEIVFDKPVEVKKTVSEADKQVILDIPNASIGKKWARRIDASQHKSNIAVISPYQSESMVRVALQLKDNGSVEISQDGKKITALIDNKQAAGAESVAQAPAGDQAATGTEAAVAENTAPAGDASSPDAAVPADAAASAEVKPAVAGGSDSLDNFFKAKEQKKWLGKKIFLQVQDMELADVFRVISEASEFNIVMSDNVKGKAMLNLTDVPWDQALDLILRTYQLAAEREGNVLRVTTKEALNIEKTAEVAAKRVVIDNEPLVTKIFTISYARLIDICGIVKDFMSKPAGAATNANTPVPVGGGGGAATSCDSSGVKGSIKADNRTNSLIIRDTEAAIETIKKVIAQLDTQTPQILIEGKFVEVTETGSRAISGRIFATSREQSPGTVGGALDFQSSNNNFQTLFNVTTPANFASSALGGANSDGLAGMGLGFAPKLGLLPGIGEIAAFLQVLESESYSKTIASPRLVTQNKESATISAGRTLSLATSAGVGVAGGLQSVSQTMSLNVTPQVTNDGSVLLNISFQQDSPGDSVTGAKANTINKSIQTKVLVDSGATLVIGGVYESGETKSESGIPLLRNLPIIGPLFGNKQSGTSKRELFIFLTPRVLNDKEAGIKG